ncbi:MAG: hypothetical protein QM779_12385 [Propionicimonas sp.]|uniref:DUF2231 domain-containing protein n=1 Tax=Propionicimonas sp. TaxID=1955623 RepID=UPI003D0FC969
MTIFGLPLHVLVVHAAVVLLPLAALGTLLIAVSARARKRYGSLVVLGSFVAAGSVVLARLSGESLNGGTQAGPGWLGVHVTWGLLAPWPAVALAVTSLPLVLAGRGKSRPFLITAALLSVVSALASIAIIVVVGHAGAEAVWGSNA